MKPLLLLPAFTLLIIAGCSDGALVDSDDPALQTEDISAGQAVKPDVIPLPTGFQPEGIVAGHGTTFFVGSLGSGAIFQGDFITGEGSLLVPPQEDGEAVGLAFDRRSNRLFVAGGTLGTAYVYDAGSGALLATYQLTELGALINDVVVTREAAYFTDSFQPLLYRVPLGPGGALPAPDAVETLTLSGDFTFVPNDFNANGIDATPDGKQLVIVNSALGALYRVDPQTGEAAQIDLGGASVPGGDGILLDGRILYVVQNFLNQIAAVRLNADLTAGTIVEVISDADFRIPTTVTEFGNALYAVNARFDIAPPGEPAPGIAFEVVRVRKP